MEIGVAHGALDAMFSQCKALRTLAKANCKVQFPFGKLVTGKVLAKNDKYAILDVELEKNAILFNNGLWGFEILSVGDCTKVYIERVSKSEGYIIVSRRRLDEIERWELMERLCVTGDEIKANVVKLTRRGIRMEVCGLVGAMFWTRELIELENEIRRRSTLIVRVNFVCKRWNAVVVTLKRPIEDSICRKTSAVVWTNVLELCDFGVWTHVDACNGVILLSGRPWCCALDLVNQLQFGKLITSNFVKMEMAVQPLRTGDCVDLIVNFVLEAENSLNWDRNVCEIDVDCVWNWIVTLTLNERERWCDWKELGNYRNALRLGCGRADMTAEVVFSEETTEEIDGTNVRQNMFWNEERLTLAKLCGGFEVKRFALSKLVLEKVRRRQLSKEDESWLRKVEKAWTCESGKLVLLKAKWRRTRVNRKWKRVLARLKVKGRDCNWKEELDFARNRRLKDVELIDRQAEIREEKLNEGEAKEVEGNWCEISSNVEDEALPIAVEDELDGEWEKEWKLNREPSYRRKHDTEADCALIETSLGRWDGLKVFRPAYAVIIGTDVQTTMLTVAITKMVLAYVCDFSIGNEDVEMFKNDWGNSLAVKVVPVALSFRIDDVMVEVDVCGYKHLRFVNVNWGRPLIGIVAKVGATDVTIALAAGVYGLLRFESSAVNFGIEVGMEVDVTIVDWNPITNVINLGLTEEGEEETNVLLVETTREVSVVATTFGENTLRKVTWSKSEKRRKRRLSLEIRGGTEYA
ncbi:MAG: hypothetical protein ACTS4U_00050 [Candidatus Hodgkinia cicadicola]